MTVDKLNVTELDGVVGGFREDNIQLPTEGMEIVCPKCNNKDGKSFAPSALYDPKIGSVEYRCKCGCKFVCYKGKVILRDDWDALCKLKGISYNF